MEVTVLKPDPDNPNGKEVAIYRNVDVIRTVYDINSDLCYMLLLSDESFDHSCLIPVQDYSLRVERK